MNRLKIVAGLLIFMPFFGCATRQSFTKVQVPEAKMQSFLANKPLELKPAYRQLLEEGKRNAVLNDMRIGLNAYNLGHKDFAIKSFDRVLRGIEVTYANSETAKNARSLWYEEGMKDFKGEPYERVMSYYYRGLLFLEDSDYENARAAFKAGILQDAFAEEDQNRCDFSLLIFLAGWASEQAGDPEMAKVAYNELHKLKSTYPLSLDNNVLVLVETGTSPRKVADGVGHSELKYRRGRHFQEETVELSLNGETLDIFPLGDIFWQAASRGGRAVDKVVKGKAVFRKTLADTGGALSDIGSTAMVMAPLFENSGAVQNVGAVLSFVGVAQMAVAMRSRPHADIRYWDNLPDKVHVFTTRLAPGEYRIKVRYKDDKGQYIPSLTNDIKLQVEANKPVLLRVDSRL